MSYRLTAGALVALVVLGVLVWFTEFRDQGGTNASSTNDARPQILTFDEANVKQIEISRGDQQVSVERQESGDWLLQPSGQPGDKLRISGLVFRLSTLRANRIAAESPDDYGQYGLSSPSLTATVTMLDGSTQALQVGGKAPAETATYVRKPDDAAVYLVSNQLVTDLDRMVSEPPIEQPTPSPSPSPSPAASPSPGP